jgi:hypothetical protein
MATTDVGPNISGLAFSALGDIGSHELTAMPERCLDQLRLIAAESPSDSGLELTLPTFGRALSSWRRWHHVQVGRTFVNPSDRVIVTNLLPSACAVSLRKLRAFHLRTLIDPAPTGPTRALTSEPGSPRTMTTLLPILAMPVHRTSNRIPGNS